MKAKILKPFAMGSSVYSEGQFVDFEPWRVERLEGEGLAVAVEEQKETLEVTPSAVEKPDSLSHKKRRKR